MYDRNGLDYINNYKYYPEYEYNGTLYQVYCKNEPIVQNSLEQRFTYLDEFLDVPNSGWLRELDKEDYYTKEQIDEKKVKETIEAIEKGTDSHVTKKHSGVKLDCFGFFEKFIPILIGLLLLI